MSPDSSSDLTAKVAQLLEGFSTAMFLTRRSEGTMHARPMAIAQRRADLQIKFVSDLESAKAHEIAENTASQLICQKDGSVYLSLTGRSALTQDRAEINELWTECLRVWFPDGPSDPNICIITFRAERAEYWDNSGINKLAHLWEAAKAYVAGERVQTGDPAKHGVVHY